MATSTGAEKINCLITEVAEMYICDMSVCSQKSAKMGRPCSDWVILANRHPKE